jgi:hypothetical protein
VSYVSPWWQALNLPDRWDVAGVVVPSLTVWHSLALAQSGNAYLCGGEVTKNDAAGLLLICGMDMDGYRRLAADLRQMDRTLYRMYRRLVRVPWGQLDAACGDYVRACTRCMRRVASKDGGHDAVAPHEWHLVRVLCRTYGMNLTEAWGTPYALARAYYDTDAEANGDKNIAPLAVQAEAEAAAGELEP